MKRRLTQQVENILLFFFLFVVIIQAIFANVTKSSSIYSTERRTCLWRAYEKENN